jgi:hypothetical protein
LIAIGNEKRRLHFFVQVIYITLADFVVLNMVAFGDPFQVVLSAKRKYSFV